LGFIATMPTLQVYRQWSAGQQITGGWSWPGVVLLVALCVVTFIALLLKIRADTTVELGDTELVRRGPFGVRRLRWSEVRRIVPIQYGLHVEGENVTIPLAPRAFRDPEAFVRKVVELAQRAGAPV